ncbi:response regulator transcription factor, partial [Aliarcobacter butzleri]|uniref:response regulator transcription factor n=1 Tax=Aliarcobacter butzleri TaxID=28197 RepID=UPI003AF89562
YVEDEEGIRDNVADSLRYYLKDVYEASNGEEGYLIYKKKSANIILSDIHMPILNGIEYIKNIRQNDRSTTVVMITAHTDKEY